MISIHDIEVAVMGISIVFASLCLLAVVIYLMPRALALWDNKGQLASKPSPVPVQTAPSVPLPLNLTAAERDMARHFYLLAQRLGEPFALPRLLYLAENLGVQRPHANLARLLAAHYVLPDDRGYFVWNEKARLSV